jgi:hypothetical protein
MSDYTEHARLSPSGSKRWMACPGSIVMEEQVPAKHNQAADNGTCCHIIAARCLTVHYPATKYIGEDVKVSAEGEEDRFVEFDENLCDLVLLYLKWARKYTIGPRVTYWVEQRVNFSGYVDVPNSFGTADLLVYDGDVRELQVHDAKFGHRPVLVENNSQLLTYALGAYDMLEMAYDIECIRIVVHQPQVNSGPIEYVVTINELMAFGKRLWDAAQKVELATQRYRSLISFGPAATDAMVEDWQNKFLNPKPNEDECAYCRAMATCPAAIKEAERIAGLTFKAMAETKEEARSFVPEAGARLDEMMAATPFLEDMLTAIRSRMEGYLLSGGVSKLFGLELGRQGHRRWSEPETVEKMLRNRFRLSIEETYNTKLKSPTQIEKMAGMIGKTHPDSYGKGGNPRRRGRPKLDPEALPVVIGPMQWEQLKAFIVRKPASPSVKPKAIIKTPYTVVGLSADAFTPVQEFPADDGDLS